MTFEEILDHAIAMLQRRGRLTYGTLKRQFQLDDAALDDLKNELIEGQRVAVDKRGTVLVCIGAAGPASPAPSPSATTQEHAPRPYTPPYLAEKILTSKAALEGERKQVTVLFADLKGSMELLADRDPEEERRLLDPVLDRLMAAVHRYEGTVNQVMGDGILALFGAPIALGHLHALPPKQLQSVYREGPGFSPSVQLRARRSAGHGSPYQSTEPTAAVMSVSILSISFYCLPTGPTTV